MKKKTIISSIILMGIILFSVQVKAEDRIDAYNNYSFNKTNNISLRMNAVSDEEVTVVETWDISATSADHVTATLYSNGKLVINGTGNMKDYYNNTVPWKKDIENIITVVIEKGVTSIGNDAFIECSSLTSVEIPEGVISIGNGVFQDCKSLTSIKIPEGVTSIGNYAFFGCSSLTSVEIPAGLTSIEYRTFGACSSLISIEIPEGVTSIGDSAFERCSSLTSVEIPEGVASIGYDAFTQCISLISIEIPKGVTSIGIGAFSYCSKLTSIEIPEGVTSIGYMAFFQCISLTSVEISEGVTGIGNRVFDNCTRLTDINIPCANDYAIQYVKDNYSDKLKILHTEVIDKKIEPTCTKVGKEEGKHCSVCNKILIVQEEIPELGHDYKEEATAPTCTEKGYTTHTCTRCNDSYVDTYTEALGHNFGEWIIDEAETCTDKGHKHRECQICDVIENQEIPELGHNYKEEVTAPTCTEKGYTTHTCTRCNDSYVDTYTEALGHDFGEWITVKEATCTEKGYTTHICTRCNDSYVDTYTEALGHNFGEWIIDKEPTYEEEGHKYRICINCNKEKQEETIPKLTQEETYINTTYRVKEKEGQKYIILQPKTKLEEALKNITSNKKIEIVEKNNKKLEANSILATGEKVKILGEEKIRYIIVVKGDINGDGQIDFIRDIVLLNDYRLNRIKLTTESILAGDIKEDDKIDFINDIVKINDYRLNRISKL